jgi:hypothetical protein
VLTDVPVSGDTNMIKKDTEKILKYKDLTIQVEHMWNVKTNVIPLIIGATGTISKSFTKYLSNITGKHEITEPRENSHIGQGIHTLESTNIKA